LHHDDPIALEAHQLGTQAGALGVRVESLAKATRVPAAEVHDEAQHLEKRARGLWARALDEAANGRRVAKHGIDKLGAGAKALGDAVKTYTEGVAHAVDYQRNIDLLGEGDSYRLSIEAFVAAAGLAVGGKGELEVEREHGRYVV